MSESNGNSASSQFEITFEQTFTQPILSTGKIFSATYLKPFQDQKNTFLKKYMYLDKNFTDLKNLDDGYSITATQRGISIEPVGSNQKIQSIDFDGYSAANVELFMINQNNVFVKTCSYSHRSYLYLLSSGPDNDFKMVELEEKFPKIDLLAKSGKLNLVLGKVLSIKDNDVLDNELASAEELKNVKLFNWSYHTKQNSDYISLTVDNQTVYCGIAESDQHGKVPGWIVNGVCYYTWGGSVHKSNKYLKVKGKILEPSVHKLAVDYHAKQKNGEKLLCCIIETPAGKKFGKCKPNKSEMWYSDGLSSGQEISKQSSTYLNKCSLVEITEEADKIPVPNYEFDEILKKLKCQAEDFLRAYDINFDKSSNFDDIKDNFIIFLKLVISRFQLED